MAKRLPTRLLVSVVVMVAEMLVMVVTVMVVMLAEMRVRLGIDYLLIFNSLLSNSLNTLVGQASPARKAGLSCPGYPGYPGCPGYDTVLYGSNVFIYAVPDQTQARS